MEKGRVQGLVPLVLFSVFGVVWVVMAAVRLPAWSGLAQVAAAVLVAIYILWLCAESRVAKSEPDKGTTRRDRGTLELYAVGRITTVTAALALTPACQELGPWHYAGLTIFVAGVLFRLYAIRTLGKFYSHRVRKVDEHRIVDTGPYRFIRHPAYTGMIVAHIGFCIFFFHPLAIALLVLFFIPSVVVRILVEEKMLFEIDGYAAYSRGRARLVPFVW